MKTNKDLTAKERLTIQIKKRKHWPWQLYVSICCILFCVIALTGILQSVYVAEAPAELADKNNKIRITFTGDVKVSNNVRKLANKIGYDELLIGISTYWRDSDCVISNVSGPVLRTTVENYISTRDADEDSDYIRPAAVRGFQSAGIDILSFANDDAYNYGTTGISTTIDMMKENQMKYLGVAASSLDSLYQTVEYTEDSPLGVLQKKQIAIISINDVIRDRSTVTDTRAGIVNSSVSDLYTDIYQISQTAEYTVAYVHFSDETSNKITTQQRTIAQALIDAGADVVVGSNATLSHMEEYHGGLILYGLGVLVSDEFYSTAVEGALLDLVVDEEGDLTAYLTPTRLKNGQVEVTDKKMYKSRIQATLTKGMDESRYFIDDNGIISISLDK